MTVLLSISAISDKLFEKYAVQFGRDMISCYRRRFDSDTPLKIKTETGLTVKDLVTKVYKERRAKRLSNTSHDIINAIIVEYKVKPHPATISEYLLQLRNKK
jgi:hypothetical protein